VRYPQGIRHKDHLRTEADDASSSGDRPLIYRLGFAVLGCALLFSAVVTFFLIIGKPSSNTDDKVALFFMAIIICGFLVWIALANLRETSRHK
jgi:hypothetical protein